MDRTLEQAVLSALYMEPLINADHILVTARDGVVTLSGEVNSHAQKSAARNKARCVHGVEQVVDELEVRARAQPRQALDDIATSVLNALYWDLAVPPDRVCAKCEKGWVTLTGEVDRAYQKSSAEADVRKIRGVVGVTNEIKVAASGAAKIEPTRRGDDQTHRGEAIILADTIGAIVDDRKKANGRREAPLP